MKNFIKLGHHKQDDMTFFDSFMVLARKDEQDVNLLPILTDRGTEFCGKVENHSYQLYPAMEDMDQSKTKANHPQTNGICERCDKTMKSEFYHIAFRKKIYTSLEE